MSFFMVMKFLLAIKFLEHPGKHSVHCFEKRVTGFVPDHQNLKWLFGCDHSSPCQFNVTGTVFRAQNGTGCILKLVAIKIICSLKFGKGFMIFSNS